MSSSSSAPRRSRPRTTTIWLPVVGSLAGLVTIVAVYWLTHRHGQLPGINYNDTDDDDDNANVNNTTTGMALVTPPISLLGCQEPARTVYQVGFSLTAVLLGGVIYQWTRWFFPLIIASSFSWSAWMMRMGAYLAVVGLGGQGVITLEHDIWTKLVKQLQQRLEESSETTAITTISLSSQSMRHQQFAAVFFLGAALHCYMTVYFTLASSSSASSTKVRRSPSSSSPSVAKTSGNASCCYGAASRRIKLVCACLSVVSWPLAQAWHPAHQHTGNTSSTTATTTTAMMLTTWNIAGLAQYIAVGSYILFFGSYAMDFADLEIVDDDGSDKTIKTNETKHDNKKES
uniref:CWH43-like N-terminal domain-containing protein n=1 Tax=Amphora coffeiformis TaxID=265554 RepID=A0A7S3KWM6_9STRA